MPIFVAAAAAAAGTRTHAATIYTTSANGHCEPPNILTAFFILPQTGRLSTEMRAEVSIFD